MRKPVKQNLDILEGKDKKEFLRGAEIAYESILTSCIWRLDKIEEFTVI